MKVTILGCGAAPGVPSISGGWGKCDPLEPRNRRLRTAILMEEGGTAILVDTGPDLREQLLRANVRRMDGILYTHGHADHTHGIDEVREINRAMKAPIPAWGMASTLNDLMRRFGYAFQPYDDIAAPGTAIYHPWLVPQVIPVPHPLPFAVGGVMVTPFLQEHGREASLGFRFGDFAYSTDVTALDETAFEILAGVKVWIVGCLTEHRHTTHADVSQVLRWVERVRPERTVFTHMGAGLDYRTLKDGLPPGVEPGYDGQIIEI